MPNSTSPEAWCEARPERPRTPNVKTRLAAVLATAVTSSEVTLASCAPITGWRRR